ncbi:hypothetical protein Nepgr_018395 [Nepenthes gracilis]|uniref:Uncharacterized protein n=1 Tax=Nepenthes gracilis TaxID=150966 RepID=A0AAD3STC2_NEPGR|nr:hypothetical protein Nepgr_018395 [Nepenthes gracilis]
MAAGEDTEGDKTGRTLAKLSDKKPSILDEDNFASSQRHPANRVLKESGQGQNIPRCSQIAGTRCWHSQPAVLSLSCPQSPRVPAQIRSNVVPFLRLVKCPFRRRPNLTR